jgi:hypothetical protein
VSAPAGDISRRERKEQAAAKEEKEKRKVEGEMERMGRELKWEMRVEDDYGREKKEAAAFARGALGVLGEEWEKGDGKGKGEGGDVTMNE